MKYPIRRLLPVAFLLIGLLPAHAEEPNKERRGMAAGTTLLTIFLKHDQSKNLGEIGKILEDEGFWKAFPPEGTTVISWYVMMGLGQVVTLEVPVEKLRAVNVAVEERGWKAFTTEFYPTYNLYPMIEDRLKNKAKKSL